MKKKVIEILGILGLMILLMFFFMFFSKNIETFSDYTDFQDNSNNFFDNSNNDLSNNDFNKDFNPITNPNPNPNPSYPNPSYPDPSSNPQPNDPYQKYFSESLIEDQSRFIDQQQDFIQMQKKNNYNNNTCVNYLPSHYGEFQSDLQIGVIKKDVYWMFTHSPGVNAEYFPIIACQQPPLTHAYNNGSTYGYDAGTPWSTVVQHSINVGIPVPTIPCN